MRQFAVRFAAWAARTPHQAWALAFGGAMLLVGIATVEDRAGAMAIDTVQIMDLGEATFRYLAGDDNAFDAVVDLQTRYYGATFETLLQVVTRIFGLEHSAVQVGRDLLTHLFFLVGGLACYLLTVRMYRSRALALFAMAFFLLHPRIYAHSFFNLKDVPFLSLFMICLLLGHRAFERGTAGAFVLCGVGSALLTNLRLMGVTFVVVVLAARVCHVWNARSRAERRRGIATSALFVLTAGCVYYISMPYLWDDPLRRIPEMWTTLSAHPTPFRDLFLGEIVTRSTVPPHYLPVWFSITTPPTTLTLGLIGVAVLVWRAAANPGDLSRNTLLGFEACVAACIALPVVAIVVLNANLYDGWRQVYFLMVPFTLLAVCGLRNIAAPVPGGSEARDSAPVTGCRKAVRARSTAVYSLAVLGVASVAAEMYNLHPHEGFYFNFLVDRATPERLRKRFHVHQDTAQDGYAYLLNQHPEATINVAWRRPPMTASLGILLANHRRLTSDPHADPDFYVVRQKSPGAFPLDAPETFFPPVVYTRKVYNNTMYIVATPDLNRVDQTTADRYRSLYREITAGQPTLTGDFDVYRSFYREYRKVVIAPPAPTGAFDVYRSPTAITWVKEDCAPGGLHWQPELTVHPAATTNHSTYMQRAFGVRVDGACLWQLALPDYAVDQIRVHGAGRITSAAYLDELRRRHAVLAAEAPTASSTWDLYLRDGTLTYAKSPCAPADTEATFFLRMVPVDASDLLSDRRRLGVDARDFQWRQVPGAVFDGMCMAIRKLPAYRIARIATGQRLPGAEDELWRVEFPVAGRAPKGGPRVEQR